MICNQKGCEMDIPFIEIIEWVTSNPNLLMWKFPDIDKEIKNGAQLNVRESQHALFINEGQIADVLGPGLHRLSTENIPILSKLKGWKYGFESPFKADVYFFSTHQFVNLRWGTPAPIMMRDLQFGQVRVRAFGSFNIRINNVAVFFKQYAGSFHQLTLSELEVQLRDFIAPIFGEVLAKANISVLDIASNITELGDRITPLLKPYFDELGLDLTKFQIVNVTLPPEVNEHYDKITNMNMVTDMERFKQFSLANAVGQQGTAANAGTQNAILMAAMTHPIRTTVSPTAGEAPPSPKSSTEEIQAKLRQLKALFDEELIDESDYKAKRAELLARL